MCSSCLDIVVVNNTQEEYTEMICILFQELEILMGLFVIVAAGCWVCCECVTCDIRKMKNKVDNGDFGNYLVIIYLLFLPPKLAAECMVCYSLFPLSL
jgi:hypothetical protein